MFLGGNRRALVVAESQGATFDQHKRRTVRDQPNRRNTGNDAQTRSTSKAQQQKMNIEFWSIGLGVFACGAFYEGSCVMWTHWAERNCALCVAIVSVLQGLCQLTGIGASLADHAYAPFFLVGYFVGPYIVVIVKQKLLGG
jgi:hypothetical protein